MRRILKTRRSAQGASVIMARESVREKVMTLINDDDDDDDDKEDDDDDRTTMMMLMMRNDDESFLLKMTFSIYIKSINVFKSLDFFFTAQSFLLRLSHDPIKSFQLSDKYELGWGGGGGRGHVGPICQKSAKLNVHIC